MIHYDDFSFSTQLFFPWGYLKFFSEDFLHILFLELATPVFLLSAFFTNIFYYFLPF